MMSDNLFDMLEYAALGTEWREWLKEVEKTADLVDLRRADTWTVLKQPAKNVHAVRWLTEELRKAATAPSPDDRTWCVLYLLAAHCRDNTVTGYVTDTFVNSYRTQHRTGTLFCMEVVGRMTLHDEYPHLNALYNLMMGLALGMAASARRGRGLSLLPDGSGLPPGGTQPAGLPVRRF